jgi:3-hydroxyisobutyrate dehydrogenase-like beta-hydroxyacid dehydrogenase
MGRGIAQNFLKKNYEVFVWNRTQAAADEFLAKGAKVCATPQAVAQKADLIFEITANDESSKEVWTSQTGILSGADKNKILVTSATLSMDWIEALNKKCQALGFTFFDMALTGGRKGAETGELHLLCGGDENKLNELKPVLSAIATKALYFGAVGQGMRYKLLLNFLQALHLIGFGQVMKVAQAFNMDLKKVGEALVDRPGGVMTKVANRDYAAEPNPINFSVEWITKDLNYMKKMAKDLKVSFLNDLLTEFEKGMQKGLAKKDWTVINKNEI